MSSGSEISFSDEWRGSSEAEPSWRRYQSCALALQSHCGGVQLQVLLQLGKGTFFLVPGHQYW